MLAVIDEKAKTTNIERHLLDQFCTGYSSKFGIVVRNIIKAILYDMVVLSK